MQIAHIYPVSNSDYMYNQKYSMLLTHLAMKYPEYLNTGMMLSSLGKYTILDNSLIENNGVALNLSDVCDMADIMEVSEVVLPDVFNNKEATIESYKRSMNYLMDRYHNNIPFKIMAVVQGKDANEFESCYRWFRDYGGMDTLGIPKVCAFKHPQGRPYFEYLWQDPDRDFDIHLLGLMYSFTELLEYKYPKKIRSVDTCQKSFLIKENKRWDSVRSNGHTVDLDNDSIQSSRLKGIRRLECLIR